ncbi:MAG: hypothetical protein ACYDCN_04775, partial [Bacteroidia bacterium]
MNRFKKVSFIIITGMLLTSILTSSCRKDPKVVTKTIIEHDTVQHAWQAEPGFNGQVQDISVAYAANGVVFFNGAEDGFMTYDSAHNQWGSAVLTGLTTPFVYSKPGVNKNFYASIKYSNNSVVLLNPYNSSVLIEYNLFPKLIDTNFTSFPSLYPFYYINSIDVTDSNRVIIPAITKDTMHSYVYVFDASINLNSISNFHKIPIDVYPHFTGQPTICHIGNRFLVTGISATPPNLPCTRLIREDFSVLQIAQNDPFSYTFKYNGNYYAFSASGNIYQTSNLGETWSLQYTVSNYNMLITNFDNNLIAISQSQIWLVTLGSTS